MNLIVESKSSHPIQLKNQANICLYLAFVMMLIDALAGPLRFYLVKAGLESLVYIPKLAVLFAMAIAIFRPVARPVVLWWVLGLLVYGWIVAIAQGVPWRASAFMVFVAAPFFLGLVTRIHWEEHRRMILTGLGILWGVTVFGVMLDVWAHFPWSGQKITTMGQEIEISRYWITQGWERYAGFTRISSNAALYIGLSGVLLVMMVRRTYWRVALFLITFVCVLLTTNKAMIGGLLILCVLWCLRWAKAKVVLISLIFIAAVMLPLVSAMLQTEIRFPTGVEKLLFDSLGSRISDTWPDFVQDISSLWLGQGLGGVGTPDQMFGSESYRIYADNFPLYLMGMFGIPLGLLAFGAIAYRMRLIERSLEYQRAIGAVMIVLLSAAIVTDIIESVIGAYLMGLAMAIPVRSVERLSRKDMGGHPLPLGGGA